jgi:uncharacterized cupin superfamily protein/RimJ/RimL family protein N-acetyltransferase
MVDKPLIIFGSARSDGNTRKAVDLVFPERDRVTFCDLNDFAIQPYSYSAEPKDDFLKVIELVISRQTIVFATPVYWYAMSTTLKIFFDRLTDLITRQKQLGRSLTGKRVFLIASGTDPKLPPGFEVPFQKTSDYFSMKYSAGIYFEFNGDTILEPNPDANEFRSSVLLDDAFTFQRLSSSDLELLHDWLQRPHVAEMWGEVPDLDGLRKKFQPHIHSENVFGYIASLKGSPFAYVQAYNAATIGEGWWPDARPGTWGIDQFLANETDLGKGFGTQLVQQFCKFVFQAHAAKTIITDPTPKNARAIRCYEKAGFYKVGIINTPDGRALLMEKLTRPDCIKHYSEIQEPDNSCYKTSNSDELLSIGSPFGKTFGFKRLGIHHELLPAGRRTSWPHAEKTEEEFVYVIEGIPDVWINGELYRLRPGDGVGFVPGTGVSHTFINNTDQPVRLLVVGDTNREDNKVFYPLHSERNKLIGDQCWHDIPKHDLGPHDGLPDALRKVRSHVATADRGE